MWRHKPCRLRMAHRRRVRRQHSIDSWVDAQEKLERRRIYKATQLLCRIATIVALKVCCKVAVSV